MQRRGEEGARGREKGKVVARRAAARRALEAISTRQPDAAPGTRRPPPRDSDTRAGPSGEETSVSTLTLTQGGGMGGEQGGGFSRLPAPGPS